MKKRTYRVVIYRTIAQALDFKLEASSLKQAQALAEKIHEEEDQGDKFYEEVTESYINNVEEI